MALPFRVELSKSSRATCKDPGCDNPKIEAKSLRVGREQSNNFFGSDSTSWKWYHPECFANLNSRARKHKVAQAQDIAGFDDLSEDDQRLMVMLVHESLQAKAKTPKASKAVKPAVGDKRKRSVDEDDDDAGTDSPAKQPKQPKQPRDDDSSPKKTKPQQPQLNAQASQPQVAPDGREVCWYGARCYRKNPAHLAQFWHPPRDGGGDSPSSTTSSSARRSASSAVSMANSGSGSDDGDQESDFVPSGSDDSDDDEPHQMDRDDDDDGDGEIDAGSRADAGKSRSARDDRTKAGNDDDDGDDSAGLPPPPKRHKPASPAPASQPARPAPAAAQPQPQLTSKPRPQPQAGQAEDREGVVASVTAFAAAVAGQPFIPDLPVEPPAGGLADRPPRLWVPMERRRNRFPIPALNG